jgi:hypothetical protein
MYDCGLELPDVRWEVTTEANKHIKVIIRRNWHETEDDEMDFDCFFEIRENGKLILTVDSEIKAISIAKIMYDIGDNDEENQE